MHAPTLLRTSLAALTATLALVHASTAGAALVQRWELLVAPGACQPFFSTTQARYSNTGLRNAGTSTFYVVCSLQGNWMGAANGGATRIGIVVSNPTAEAASVSCTARPGYTHLGYNGQIALPKTQVVPAGQVHSFVWTTQEYPSYSAFRNPNFTCTLPPGVELNYLETLYNEDVLS